MGNLGKKELLARGLVKTGLIRAVDQYYRWRHHDIKVLAYHRVLPRQPEAGFPFDLELMSAWQDEFEWQMAFVKRHYDVISCAQLASLLDAGRWPDRGTALITFDDGFRDNHQYALPVLQRHGLSATIFVTTDYIGTDRHYWFDVLVHDLLHTRATHLSLGPGQEDVAVGPSEAERRALSDQLLRRAKRLPNTRREQQIAEWRAQLAVGPQPGVDYRVHQPMGWDEVRALVAGGLEVGSHTVSHPVLPQVESDDDLRRELLQSKQTLESGLGRPVIALAYPTGGPGAYSERVITMAKEVGYRFAFIYPTGINGRQQWSPYEIGRRSVERYTSRERFVATLAAPDVF